MTFKASLWITLLLIPIITFSQQTHRCHSDERMETAFQLDPEYKKALLKEQSQPSTLPSNSQKAMMNIVTIPVHVILVHPPGQPIGTGDNFSLAHVESQIQVLNEDFRRMNADAGNTPSVFPADDSEIEFCLAAFDENGNPTDGITRYGTNDNLDDDEFSIKSATGWDRNLYLNFWVGSGLGGILGWAYLPSTNNLPNATLDGVVVASCTFGGPGFGSCTPYHLGRTGTHEVGHYLGLRHVWGNGGCNSDDNIADTPIQTGSNFGCPNHPDPSCNNGGDMFMNYMDYVNDNCMNAFTTGQATRMNQILNNSRSSLLTAANTKCQSSGVPLTLSISSQTDVTCNGLNDGTITVNATGGSGTFTYSIDGGNGQNSNTFTGVAAGNHVIEVDDGSSTLSITVTITEPDVLFPIVTDQFDVSCFGENDAILTVSAVGGTNNTGPGGYQFSLDNGNYTPNTSFFNLSAGVYTLNVKDENDCISNTSVIINEPSELISFIQNEVGIDCAGQSNGSVEIASIGGNPNYQYSLDQSQYTFNNVFTNLSSGTYFLSTLDDNGCDHQFTFTLAEPNSMVVNISQQTNLDCFGDSNGMIEVNAQGGGSGFQYAINNGGFQSNPIFNNLTGGNYVVTVQDANGCIEVLNTTISEPAELTMNIANQINVNCFGENTGSISVNAIGGSGNLNISMNGTTMTGNSVSFENLSAGNYMILVEDANNCSQLTSVDITQNDEITLFATNTQNVNCNGDNNGQITVESLGGAGDFTYSINGNNQNNNNVFTNLSGGNYTIESTDVVGCVTDIIVTIDEPAELISQVNQQTNIDCFGANNGSVQLSASGGNGTIQFSIGNETNSSGVFNNLPAGNFNAIIFDENNCTETLNLTITEPSEIIAQVANSTSVNCFGNNNGAFEISVSGGNSNYTFDNGMTSNATGIFNNLSAGNYLVTVTDGNNCTTTIESNISQPNQLVTNIANQQNVNCFGENSGSISLQANGGVGNITFTLNGNSNATGDFQNLPSGNYSIIATDENNCESIVTISIDEPTELNLSITNITQASCAGQEGAIQVNATGGTGSYQYSIPNNSNSSGNFSGLTGGTYNVQVTDGNGCTTSVEVDINEPNAINASVAQIQNINCFGNNNGSVQITANGGAGTLTYMLGNETNTTGQFSNLTAGNYGVIVTDDNNCTSTIALEITQPDELITNILTQQNVNCFGENSGSVSLQANGGVGNITFTLNGNSNTTGDFQNLTVGNYNIIATDENNCESIVTISIDEPTELNLSVTTVTQASCAGDEGAIQVDATGGVGGYQYSIPNNSNNSGNFAGLSGGIYNVQVTDANGCTATVQVDINEPNALNASVDQIQNVNCFGDNNGSFQIIGNGGAGTLTYMLGNETNTTGQFSNLTAGNYDVVIADDNNCTSTINVSITQPDELIISTTSVAMPSCWEGTDGAVNLAATGGTGNLTYSLASQNNSSGIFENLENGTYLFNVADENGCVDQIEIQITAPTSITTMINDMQHISCAGANDGIADLSAIGGTGSYTYTLGNESNTTGYFDGIAAGNYVVLITDENDCVSELTLDYNEPQSITFVTINLQDIDCSGDATGFVQLDANGGTGTLTYTLGTETNTTGEFENLPSGNYALQITDENNCIITDNIQIIDATPIQPIVENISDANCFGENSGLIDFTAMGGAGGFEYTIGNETNTTGLFENLPAGFYEIIFTDANDCTTSMNITINQPSPVISTANEITGIHCYGDSNGSIQLTGMGGIGNYIYSLNNDSNTTGLFENLSAGDYDFVIQDGNGCESVTTFTLTQPDEILISIIDETPADCAGSATGTVTVQGMNGVGTFEYQLNNETNTTGIFENLAAGIYDLVVTDANGCIAERSVPVSENSDIAVESNWSMNVDCFGNDNGEIHVVAASIAGAVTFELDGIGTISSTGDFENLPPGIYNVIITDVNNCSLILPFEITEPMEVNLEVTAISNIDCFGDDTGVVNLNATGGAENFTYTIDGNSNMIGIFENLSAGTFTANVVDGNGCTQMQTIEIVQPDELTISLNASTPDLGNDDGSATFDGVGGVSPYTYSINGIDYQSVNIFENLSGGGYDIFIQDANGCITQSTFTIEMQTSTFTPNNTITSLDIFPNPFSENLFLEINITIAQQFQINMWTVTGQVVYQNNVDLGQGKHTIPLDYDTGMAAGVYVLQVSNQDGEVGYFKLIKQ